MRRKRGNIDNHIDYTLVFPVIILIGIGLVAIYSVMSNDYPDRVIPAMFQQAIWILLGCGLAGLLMFCTTKFLWKATPIFYAIGLILLVLPLYFYSPSLVASTGAKNWITVEGLTLFQPSEFMKIAYILMLARFSIWFQQKNTQNSLDADWKLLGIYSLITLPVLILLALQRDLGTSIVFLSILVGVIILSGISWWIILPFAGGFLVLFMLFLGIFLMPSGKEFLYHMGMDTYQINRILSWIDPFSYAKTIAYQQTQGMISIGTGGLTGKGFNHLELSVPVRESDMIFTVIAEDFGFIGSAFILGLYLILIYRMLKVTLESNNKFYSFISVGFTMMLLFHVFENIGATIGILPLTGIPLPFISQGGSSLVSNLIGVGIVLSIYYQNKIKNEQRIDDYFKQFE